MLLASSFENTSINSFTVWSNILAVLLCKLKSADAQIISSSCLLKLIILSSLWLLHLLKPSKINGSNFLF